MLAETDGPEPAEFVPVLSPDDLALRARQERFDLTLQLTAAFLWCTAAVALTVKIAPIVAAYGL